MTTIRVPDIGDASNVTVIEVAVTSGDQVAEGDTLIVLESDKASMEIPADAAGTVGAIHVKEGSEVSEGDVICELEGASAEAVSPAAAESPAPVSEPQVGAGDEAVIAVPDTGSAEGVTVIEVSVAVGDQVSEGDTLIVLESDKASMEIPAPQSGIVGALLVYEGEQEVQDDAICTLQSVGGSSPAQAPSPAEASAQPSPAPEATPAPSSAGESELVVVPDTGSAEGVTVIEIAVAAGDRVAEGDTLIVLESDKASMEIPSPVAGVIESLSVKDGDQVKQGDPIAKVAGEGAPVSAPASTSTPPVAKEAAAKPPEPTAVASPKEVINTPVGVHAGPAVRALARELGVDLTQLSGSGPKGRITKDDLHQYVKTQLASQSAPGAGVASGSGIPSIPMVDFAAFGPIERRPMSKIHRLTADNMTRCLLNVPAVTQFDEADITDLEAFRKSMKAEAEKRAVRLTPLPFLIKACAHALKALPQVNASIDVESQDIILKQYVHIGIAVDTPDGLMVPVLRDADQKGLWELAAEASELADKAKNKKLKPQDMQGATFTISSLGSIGGTAFTPIVPAPQAAILGVSKASMQPVWDGSAFQPRLMLPLCLSYDHRVINGGDGARFTSTLNQVLGDIRHMLF